MSKQLEVQRNFSEFGELLSYLETTATRQYQPDAPIRCPFRAVLEVNVDYNGQSFPLGTQICTSLTKANDQIGRCNIYPKGHPQTTEVKCINQLPGQVIFTPKTS